MYLENFFNSWSIGYFRENFPKNIILLIEAVDNFLTRFKKRIETQKKKILSRVSPNI